MSPLPSGETAARSFPNPFGPLVGQPLNERELDIEDINAEAFAACERLVKDVSAGGFSASLSVFGEAGTGKTHLLGRVRRRLAEQPDKLFVFVRMETSPTGIRRHLRRSLALALLRVEGNGLRTLDRLLAHRKGELELLEHRDLSIALTNLLEGRHVRDSAAWLRGEGLPEEALAALGLSAPTADEEPEVTARHITIAICDLIRPGTVVWCMDQIEAVLSSPADREGPHAFGQVVSSLSDETRNSAVICCLQTNFMNLMEQILDGPARQRVMGRSAGIRALSWDQAQRLIGGRLDQTPELARERAGRNGCWPLQEARIQEVFTDGVAPARRVIARCRDLFDLWRTGTETPEVPLGQVLQSLLDERYTTKEPAQTESILRNGLPLLARACGVECAPAGARSPLDFTLNGGAAGVAIVNEAHSRTLLGRLKKLTDAGLPAPRQRLVLLRDARTPISPTARVTRKKLADIQEQGARLVTVSQEAVEALAALRRLLSDSESGDLAHRGDPIPAGKVEQWIAGHLPDSLDPLVNEFGGARGNADSFSPLSGRLAELLAERKMIRVADAARSLEVTSEAVEECARRDPRQFGLLRGGVAALFQPVVQAVDAAAEGR